MKAICVFCGHETELPIEEVVLHQEGTLTVRSKRAPAPYAEIKIRCSECQKVFSYPCGVWTGIEEGIAPLGEKPVVKVLDSGTNHAQNSPTPFKNRH